MWSVLEESHAIQETEAESHLREKIQSLIAPQRAGLRMLK
jgi:hypothetical protein